MVEVPGQIFSGETFSPNQSWLLEHRTMQVKGVGIDPAARDAVGGHTPETDLRSGLVMGQVTASKLWKEYDDGDSDGTEVAKGVLLHPLRLLDPFGGALTGLIVAAVVIGARVRESLLLGLDAAGETDLEENFIFEEDFE